MSNKRPAMSNIGIEIGFTVVALWAKMQPFSFELVHENAIDYLKRNCLTGKEMVYCGHETGKKGGRSKIFGFILLTARI